MVSYIGVKSGFDLGIKRDLLLFDRVGLSNLGSALESMDAQTRGDAEYLLGQGAIFEADWAGATSRDDFSHRSSHILHLSAALIAVAAMVRFGPPLESTSPLIPLVEAFGRAGALGWFDYELRLLALDLERTSNVRATPILRENPRREEWEITKRIAWVARQLQEQRIALARAFDSLPEDERDLGYRALRRADHALEKLRANALDTQEQFQLADVVEVVLHQLPVPDEGTPLEQILGFRTDPDIDVHREQLRRWMRQVAQGADRLVNVEEELQYLMSAFEDHLRLHRMKAERGMLQTVLTVPLEVAEALVKLRWSDAVKPLFSIRTGKVALMEAERSAPGREVAYITKARQHFRSAKQSDK